MLANGILVFPTLRLSCDTNYSASLSVSIYFGDSASISSRSPSSHSIRTNFYPLEATWRIDDTEPYTDYQWTAGDDDATEVFAVGPLAWTLARQLINGARFLIHIKDTEGKTYFASFAIDSYFGSLHPAQQVLEQCSSLMEGGIVVVSELGTSTTAPPRHWTYDVTKAYGTITDKTHASISVGDANIWTGKTRIATTGRLNIHCAEGQHLSISGGIGLPSDNLDHRDAIRWLFDNGAVVLGGNAYPGKDAYGHKAVDFYLEEQQDFVVEFVRDMLAGNSLGVQIEASNGSTYYAEFPLGNFVGSEHPVRRVLAACGHKAS